MDLFSTTFIQFSFSLCPILLPHPLPMLIPRACPGKPPAHSECVPRGTQPKTGVHVTFIDPLSQPQTYPLAQEAPRSFWKLHRNVFVWLLTCFRSEPLPIRLSSETSTKSYFWLPHSSYIFLLFVLRFFQLALTQSPHAVA